MSATDAPGREAGGFPFSLRGDLLRRVAEEAVDEVFRATNKHGAESMASPLLGVGKRLGILGEEYGEVCRATTYDNGDRANLREELIQTAAMALAWAYAIDLEDEG